MYVVTNEKIVIILIPLCGERGESSVIKRLIVIGYKRGPYTHTHVVCILHTCFMSLCVCSCMSLSIFYCHQYCVTVLLYWKSDVFIVS